jgi:TPR repeat protein
VLDGGEAVSWYRKAVSQKYAPAEYKLGLLYFEGKVVAQDLGEGLRWLRKAAEHGSAAAENEIAYGYEHGQGVGQNYPEAAKWYRRAAEHGLPEARLNLEILAARQERRAPAGAAEAAVPSSGGLVGQAQGFVGGPH